MTEETSYPLYHIARIGLGNLYAAAKPPAQRLHAAFKHLQAKNVSTLLSLLEPHEAIELGLEYDPEIFNQYRIAATNFPIADFGVPDAQQLHTLVTAQHESITRGNNTVIHCRGGIGRTGMLCCCLLIADGKSAKAATETVIKQRGYNVPETAEQIAIIKSFHFSTRNTNQ